MKMGGGKVTLNDVPAYAGFAAVDILMGATAMPDDDPRNKVFPGKFAYGGGHVIEDLVAGKDVRLTAATYGTDCYPRKTLDTWIRLADMNEAVLFNMRNAYQNYNVAVNLSDRVIYTYMGVLQPRMRNANYCTAGQLSPLLNDPHYRTIGVGTRIFLGGGQGYVVSHGTQHNPGVPRTDGGVPQRGGRHPGGHGGFETDEPQVAPGGLLHRLRRHPDGGPRASHTHSRRGDLGVRGGDRRRHHRAGGGLQRGLSQRQTGDPGRK